MFLMILIVFVMIFSFLFKQKTAYEMRISDWSSDVCSSDLEPLLATPGKLVKAGRHRRSQDGNARRQRKHHRQQRIAKRQDGEHQPDHRIGKAYDDDVAPFVLEVVPSIGRSEEHTSELQSLMRISYAVFCLKKKKKTNKT